MRTIINNINIDNKLFITFSIQLLQIDLQSRHVKEQSIQTKWDLKLKRKSLNSQQRYKMDVKKILKTWTVCFEGSHQADQSSFSKASLLFAALEAEFVLITGSLGAGVIVP